MKIRYGMVSLLLCVSMVMMCGCGKTYSAELEIGDSSNEDLGTVKENNIVTTDIVDNDNNTINADDINQSWTIQKYIKDLAKEWNVHIHSQ